MITGTARAAREISDVRKKELNEKDFKFGERTARITTDVSATREDMRLPRATCQVRVALGPCRSPARRRQPLGPPGHAWLRAGTSPAPATWGTDLVTRSDCPATRWGRPWVSAAAEGPAAATAAPRATAGGGAARAAPDEVRATHTRVSRADPAHVLGESPSRAERCATTGRATPAEL